MRFILDYVHLNVYPEYILIHQRECRSTNYIFF